MVLELSYSASGVAGIVPAAAEFPRVNAGTNLAFIEHDTFTDNVCHRILLWYSIQTVIRILSATPISIVLIRLTVLDGGVMLLLLLDVQPVVGVLL